MISAFETLFVEADALFYILFGLTLILFVAEAVVPSFGVLGLGGIFLGFGCIVARCVTGENTTTEIVLFIVYIVLIIAALVVIAKVINATRLHIKREKKFTVVDGVKVPLTDEGNLDYSFLLGKEGEVISDLKPIGKVKIDGNIFEATAEKGYIYNGTLIKVEKIANQRIIVRKRG